MTALPPFLILLDLSALVTDNTRLWQEFSRVGDCLVPKAVMEEIQQLANHASEPAIEQSAREFIRFFPTSGWKTTTSIATHPMLQPAEGHELSKKARLTLAVAQAAYGLSQNRPEALVVVVGSDQGLMRRIRALKISNLCCIPIPALVQWSRTQAKPPIVLQQLQTMRSTVGTAVAVATPAASYRSATSVSPARTTRTATMEPKRASVQRSTKPGFRPSRIFFNLLTVAIVAILGLGAWRVIHPVSFTQLLQQFSFSNQSPTQKLPPFKK